MELTWITVMDISIGCCIVFLRKGAITEVILVYHFNAREFLHENAMFSREFCISLEKFAWDAKFSCKFCMGMQLL